MGLDLALGVVVLFMAVRGWLKGFLVQMIRLVGLVAAVYVAEPVRDQVKPFVVQYLPSIRPDLVDRLLWWTSGIVSYFVLVGLASLAIAVSRRHTFGIDDPRRGDQFAGFALGMAKGLVVAAFLVACLQKFALPQIEKIHWADEQSKTSLAWKCNERYHPASRIWRSPPVQQLVAHVQKMGLMRPSGSTSVDAETPVQTASRTPHLALPTLPDLQSQIDTSGVDPELAEAVNSILKQLHGQDGRDRD
jgi:uncharacterized membrane protein required for colicin V production